MEPKISIVVPVYKVEKYIKRCIDSILGQTYSNFELILINDGSPDDCGTICEEYKKKDDRIIVIHKSNGGLSSARNAGINIATGEYIGFVDSDDWIEPDMYEVLVRNIIKADADISICKIIVEYNDQGKFLNKGNSEMKLMSSEEAMKYMVEQSLFDTGAFDKLYKTSLFDDIRYPEGKIYEDLATTYKLIHKSKKVIFTNSPKYHYILNPNSIMRSKFNLSQLDMLDASKELYHFIQKHYPNLIAAALCRYVTANIGIILLMTRSNYDDYNLYSKCRTVVKNNISLYLKAAWVKPKMKSYALTVFLGPWVFKMWNECIVAYKRLRTKLF